MAGLVSKDSEIWLLAFPEGVARPVMERATRILSHVPEDTTPASLAVVASASVPLCLSF